MGFLAEKFKIQITPVVTISALHLTFTFCDVGYRQIALGLAAGNVIMIFGDRQCAVGRRARTAPVAQKSLLQEVAQW